MQRDPLTGSTYRRCAPEMELADGGDVPAGAVDGGPQEQGARCTARHCPRLLKLVRGSGRSPSRGARGTQIGRLVSRWRSGFNERHASGLGSDVRVAGAGPHRRCVV